MENIKITIVVPIYNVAPYITDCIQSIMRQTYQGKMECLLIDDCGTDNSIEIVEGILKSYQGKIDFKICNHDRNRGLSAARNTGINHATGEYIYFLDSDDEITSDCIEKLSSPLNKESYDFVIGGYRITGIKHSAPPLLLADGMALKDLNIMQDYYDGKWYMMVCGKLCNLSFLRKNQLFFEEGLIHEDELWSFQLACLAQSMYVVNQETYIYKIREGSITMNQKTQERKAVAFQKIIGCMADFLLERNITSKYAYLKLFGMLAMFDNHLTEWTGLDQNEQNKIIIPLRKSIGRIPFSMRFSCCMINIKKLILYGNVLLPIHIYHSYNRLINWLISHCKSKKR